MKKVINRIIMLIILFNICCCFCVKAEEKIPSSVITQVEKKQAVDNSGIKDNKDLVDNESTLLKVMLIVLITWIALSAYIYFLNRKVKKMEKKLDEK